MAPITTMPCTKLDPDIKRRVKNRGNIANDDPAAECGQHEDVECDKTGNGNRKVHFGLLYFQAAFVGDLVARCLALGGRLRRLFFRGLAHLSGVSKSGLSEDFIGPVNLDDVVLQHQSEQVVLVMGV